MNPTTAQDIADNLGLLQQALLEARGILGERNYAILEMRRGLHNGKPKTLEQVGRRFGVTRERIRQIELWSVRKLKSTLRYRMLMQEFGIPVRKGGAK